MTEERDETGTASAGTAARDRVLDAAMRLFGSQGYSATTIAQIESAAGLRPGSGGLYRHFTSKRELLESGVREQLRAQPELFALIGDPAELAARPLRERLEVVAHAALARLTSERDLNRIILRDLEQFPQLLEMVRVDEMQRIQSMLARWLSIQADPDLHLDWDAVATVLMGSVSHFWLLQDAMGSHPSELDEDRFVRALADLVSRVLAPSIGPAGIRS